MFNIVFIVGPHGGMVRLTYYTAEARDAAFAAWTAAFKKWLNDADDFLSMTIADDIGQTFNACASPIHGILLTSAASDAYMNMAPHLVQMESNKLLAKLKAENPEFAAYVLQAQRAQQRAAAGPGGVPILPLN